MSRKVEAIDLMKLYAAGSTNGWNEFLTECLRAQNMDRLAKTLYAIQAGMDDLVKKRLNDPKMTEWFVRLQKSIELTMRKILRLKYPNPLDNPMNSKNPELANRKWLEIKRKRDHELERYMRKASY